jgi:hypothetical protein
MPIRKLTRFAQMRLPGFEREKLMRRLPTLVGGSTGARKRGLARSMPSVAAMLAKVCQVSSSAMSRFAFSPVRHCSVWSS